MQEPTAEQVKGWTEAMLREIDADIEAGRVPATIAAFDDLDLYVDANEYGIDADIPVDFESDDPWTCVRRAQNAVDVALRERANPKALDLSMMIARGEPLTALIGDARQGHTR